MILAMSFAILIPTRRAWGDYSSYFLRDSLQVLPDVFILNGALGEGFRANGNYKIYKTN